MSPVNLKDTPPSSHAPQAEIISGSQRWGRWFRTREKIRSRKRTHHPYRFAVFLVGLLCVAVGIALSPLPGPLTIPPILLGVYIWSSEFAWAHRWLGQLTTKGQLAWQHAKKHPVADAGLTVLGLIITVSILWAANHYGLVDKTGQWLWRWWNS